MRRLVAVLIFVVWFGGGRVWAQTPQPLAKPEDLGLMVPRGKKAFVVTDKNVLVPVAVTTAAASPRCITDPEYNTSPSCLSTGSDSPVSAAWSAETFWQWIILQSTSFQFNSGKVYGAANCSTRLLARASRIGALTGTAQPMPAS